MTADPVLRPPFDAPFDAPLDAPLLRRTRWRLAAWSAAATLVTLLVLAVLLYVTLNAALSGSSEQRLRDQATGTEQLIQRFGDRALPAVLGGQLNDDEHLGQPQFGGPGAGTVTVLVAPDGDVIGQLPVDLASQLPVRAGLSEARSGTVRLELATVNQTPVRVLNQPMQIGQQTWVIQILQDRTNEQRVLDTLFVVLLVGGLAVLVASVAFGYLYAGRALIPIRESLRRQREFAANASHELRTPITVIKGSVEALRRRGDQAAVASTLDDMEAEADHLTALVGDLLLLARADSGAVELRREPIDLTDAAGEALRSLAGTAEARGVTLRLDGSPSPVTGDADRLRQLFGIVVDNAVKHSARDGVVEVSVRPDGRQVVASVEDHGPGIAAEHLERVFDRFWRAPNAVHDGTGLGLSIARWITQQHGGSITAANRSGGGAQFEIRLPQAR